MTELVNSMLKGMMAAIDDDTDFTIKLDEYSWRVHMDLLTKHSTFFKTMLEGPWKECRENCADIHDDNPWMLARMIQFFYCGTYDYKQDVAAVTFAGFDRSPFTVLGTPDFGVSQIRPQPPLSLRKLMSRIPRSPKFGEVQAADSRLLEAEIDIAMYMMADKYGVQDLQAHSLKCFKTRHIHYHIMPKLLGGDFYLLINRDHELKKVVASKVASRYEDLRKHNSAWIEGLIISDPCFGIMIMDCMKDVKEPIKTIGIFDGPWSAATSSRQSLSFLQTPANIKIPIFGTPATFNFGSSRTPPRV